MAIAGEVVENIFRDFSFHYLDWRRRRRRRGGCLPRLGAGVDGEILFFQIGYCCLSDNPRAESAKWVSSLRVEICCSHPSQAQKAKQGTLTRDTLKTEHAL